MIGPITLRLWWFAIAVVCGGCSDYAGDGSGLVVEILADQPRFPEQGVSLEVHARGGRGVHLSVEQGTFRINSRGDTISPTQTAGCFEGRTKPELFSFAMSVRPVAAEALLYATLNTQPDCSGEIVQDRLVPIRALTTNPVPQDAGAATEDAP
jgi:hypothetical protein